MRYPIDAPCDVNARHADDPRIRSSGILLSCDSTQVYLDALSALGSKLNGGPYNAPGSCEVYYIAPNAEVALRETQAVDPSGVPKRITPLTLFTIDVELQYIVDLTNDAALRALNLSAASITHEWRAAASAGTTPITHEIGTSARRADVEALLYPSARVRGAANLAVIVDRLRVGSTLRINPAEGFGPGTPIVVHGTR